ncbi:hypothetical protein [Oerskovia flava]|uniref:hypothetical protein n=1 Tax=Oerskovia flava TaxID=2986422 RepID=UPI0022408B68|nr:hypothetical protein [Oerskovia sp. JB1-3-2]
MNYENVVKSFFLGAIIGLALQVFSPGEADAPTRVLVVLASGGVGLLIGLVTEWLTALLPIRIARAGAYFLINNLIAVAITAIVVVSLVALNGEGVARADVWWPVLGVAVGIVSVANLVDYLLYRRAQLRLRALQAQLADAATAERSEV